MGLVYLPTWMVDVYGKCIWGNTPVPEMLWSLFAENCPQKATNDSHLDLNAQQLQMRLPSTLFSLLQTLWYSMDLKVWESWIIGYVFSIFIYISAPPWKSLYLQNIKQYNILRKTVENPQNRWSQLARDDHHCLTFQAFGWFFVSGGVSGSATVTCCALRVLFWTLQWDRVSLNLYNKGCFGPQNSNFWGVRILRVNNFLRQSVSPNFSLPDFPETLQMFTSQPFFYLVASIQLT